MSVANFTPPFASHRDDRFHWTVEKFYRASDAGVFDEPKQWELVNGDLWKKEVVNPPHAETTDLIGNLFRSLLSPQFRIREEKPIHLSVDTELIPDIAVVAVRDSGYGKRHPSPADILLLVEVADTSVDRDTIEKASVYAGAGIADYWVSLIPTRELVVFRQPSSEGYREVARMTDGDVIRPLAAPDVEFAVRDLIVPANEDAID